jgi:hypothetical protein
MKLLTRFRLWWWKLKRERKAEKYKDIEQAEADYLEAMEQYSPLKREWRIRRFVALNFPGFHAHRNPRNA